LTSLFILFRYNNCDLRLWKGILGYENRKYRRIRCGTKAMKESGVEIETIGEMNTNTELLENR